MSPVTLAQATKAIKNLHLEAGNNKTAVVIGGTGGIGEAVAGVLAQVGFGRILILGRSLEKGRLVVEKLDNISAGRHEFIRGDVGDVKGMKATADALVEAAGPTGFDYVFLTQGIPPSGVIRDNADGEEVGFATQSQSRFALSYFLTERGALAKNATIVLVANTGKSLDDLDVEDLSLRKKAPGRSQTLFFFDQSSRDSSVLDSVTLELNARYPQYIYLHLHPGVVKTPNILTWGGPDRPLPFLLKFLIRLFAGFASRPEDYAYVPVYLALYHSEFGGQKFFDHKFNAVQPGRWAQSPSNREALWKKLLQMIGR